MHLIWPYSLRLQAFFGLPAYLFSFLSTYVTSIFSLATFNLVFLVLYKMQSPSIEQYKVIKDEKWPWFEDPEAWQNTLRKTLATVIFNIVVLQPIFFTGLILLFDTRVPYGYTQETLPTVSTLIWQIAFCIYIEDIGQSVTHMMLHSRLLYGRFHKQHHLYNHTVSIASAYLSPVEYFLNSMLSAAIPTILLWDKMHQATVWVWVIVRIGGTTANHSGYDLPWYPLELLPMRTSPSYHDFHHSGGDFSGNFSGSTSVLDTILGTNKRYYADKKRKQT